MTQWMMLISTITTVVLPAIQAPASPMDDAAALQIPDDFLQILRCSLKSSETLVEALADTGGVPQSEHIRKIIEAVIWHRKFILTYYIWVVTVVAVSCGHEIYKRRHRRSSRSGDIIIHGSVETSSSSSSSSTLAGTNTPWQKDDDVNISEATPLIERATTSPGRVRPSLRNRFSSFLLYQPRPIPAITSCIDTLPDNGKTLLVLFFLAVNLFYLFYRAPFSLQWIFILVDRAGLLFVANLPVLYILAAKNNQPIRYLTGWSYEGLNIFHRRLGEWMTCFAVIHMCGMLLVWYTILHPLGFTFLRYLMTKVVFLGICAVISYYIIYISSVGWFRYLYYEAFLALHIFFQSAALAFLFFHHPTTKPYVGAAFVIWIVDRVIWRIATSNRKFIATLEVAPDGQTVLLHADIPLRHQKPILRPNLHHGWAPGQHVFVTIPSMGFKYRFQAHPFTITSPAPPHTQKSVQKSWPLQLTIRAIDGFSFDLLKYARFHQHCEITLDGPYGSNSALEAAHAADRVLFIAGGSGIAVTYPLAWDIRVHDHAKADAIVTTRTVYDNGSKKWPPQTLECGPLAAKTKYAHFWVRRDEEHEKWITMIPKASAVKQCPSTDGFQYPTTTVGVSGLEAVASLVTTTFNTRVLGPDGGRPDIKSEIWNWVTAISSEPPSRSSSSLGIEGAGPDRSFLSSNEGCKHKETICIIVSGPDGLVRNVRNIAAELVKQGWDIEVHVEKFGW